MLNDLRTFTRTIIFVQTMAVGSIVGVMLYFPLFHVRFGWQAFGAPMVAMVLGLAVGAALYTAIIRWARGADRAVKLDAQAGTAEIFTGRTPPGPTVPARVVRSRSGAGYEGGILGMTRHPVAAHRMVVLTVLPPQNPPRRVCALVPGHLPADAMADKSSHGIVLHPGRMQVGVIDGRVSAADRAALAHDPRWNTDTLPTDRSVAGGYGWLSFVAVVGLIVGVGIAIGLTALIV